MNTLLYFVQSAMSGSFARRDNTQATGHVLDAVSLPQEHPVASRDPLLCELDSLVFVTRQCLFTSLMVCLPLLARSESGSDLLRNTFKSSMNNVAVKIAEIPEHDRYWIVRGLDFSPDGGDLAIDSKETIELWDWRKTHANHSIEKPNGSNDLSVANPLRFSIDGHLLAVCEKSSADNVMVRIWDTSTWRIIKELKTTGEVTNSGTCTDIVFSRDGRLLIRTADTGGTGVNNVIAYSVETWEPQWAFPIKFFDPVSIATSPDGKLALIAGQLSTAASASGDSSKRTNALRMFDPYIYFIDLEHQKIIDGILVDSMGPLAWSPDGDRAVIAGGGGFDIVDVRSRRVVLHENIENSGYMHVQFTPDGRYLISSDLNGMGKGLGVNIVDSQSRKLLQHIPGDIGDIAISHDGKYLAVGMTGRTTVWQLK